ncbi:MAG TPA: PIG-L deacetylase family protein [Anaerolineae bacterium]|nr:PIG-L deacetylase family protein [Anaerolineae bacterium]
MSRKCLMAFLAHPDDESFGPGGTLAKFAAEGVDVHIVIATDGAAGSVAEGFEGIHEELAAVRAKELEAAVAILGGTLHRLDYRDSGYINDPANEHPDAFIQADETEAVGRLVALIRELRPQVILTHDETGGYFHPDHIFCWKIMTAAFEAAGQAGMYPEIGPEPYQPERLYYTVIPNRWLKLFIWAMRLRGQDPTKAGRNQDIDMTRIGVDPTKITTSVYVKPYLATKQAASAEHSSQGGGGGFTRFIPRVVLNWLFRYEMFMRAYPPVSAPLRENSFF